MNDTKKTDVSVRDNKATGIASRVHGANIDAVQTAGRFGIAPDRAVDYLSDSEGTKLNFKVMSAAVTTFREAGAVDSACFEEIRKDVRRRGGLK